MSNPKENLPREQSEFSASNGSAANVSGELPQIKRTHNQWLHRIVGRRYHDADKRRYGSIIGIKHGMPLMQLATGRRFLIFPDALERNWIQCDESPNDQADSPEKKT